MAWPWDDINALGDRLASGYDPRDPTPPADISTYGAQAGQIIADLYGQYPGLQAQPANVQQQLYATVISGLKDNKGNEGAVRAALPGVASKIVSDGNAAAQSLGRLAPGDPSTTDPNGLIILPNGDRLDNNNHLIIHKDGTVTGISAGASQTAAESAASLASANANNAAANRSNILSGIDLQNAARAGQETFPGSGIIWKADGTVAANGALTAKDKADIQVAQDQVRVQQANSTETARHDTATETNEASRLANDASYQQGQLGIGQEGNRLRGVEIGNTATYQQGQLNQGEQRIGLDTAIAQADAAAKAQQNDLARQQYIAKVLSSPSDFISRAFMQRGEASPLSQVTHADLINQVNREYANAPTAFTAPQTPTNTLLQPNAPAPTASYAFGTPDTSGIQPQGRLEDPAIKKLQGSVDAVGKLLQHIKDPVTLHRLVDELSDQRGRLQAMMPQPQDPGNAPFVFPPSAPPNKEGDAGPYYNPLEDANGELNWNGDALPTNSGGQTQRLAAGGMVNDKVAIVGDPQVAGVPNPEVIHNPTGAPISVTPMNRLQGGVRAYADGTNSGSSGSDGSAASPVNSSISNSTGYSWNGSGWSAPAAAAAPSTSGMTLGTALTNPNWAAQNAALKPTPYVAPTIPGITMPSLSIPRLAPVVAPAPVVSQEELVNQAQQNLPPALKALFGGTATAAPYDTLNRTQNPLSDTAIKPLNFGFSLFSPQSLAQLTDAEKQALDSYLGVKYNTTLADVATGMQQSFGRLSGGSSSGGGRLKIG